MIIINARFLTQPVTGVQRFAIEISKLLKVKLGNKVQFVTCPGVIHNQLCEELDAKVIGFNKSHLWEQIDLYLYLKTNNNPLLVSFSATGPLFYKNQIVSIHDVAFKYYKDSFSKGFAFIYNNLVPKIARKCLHIFTVSEAAKVELVKELEVPKDKITVIYNGISNVFKSQDSLNFEKEANKPYVLTVSSHHPRKNYERLIEAFKKLNSDDVELYIIGNFISHFSGKTEIEPHKNIKFLTDISDKELVSYYKNAELFVFPSLYEGFGIPVIEAMSQNLPCVISDIPVFKEIGDDSVIYVNPKQVESIKQGIAKGLELKKAHIDYPKLEIFTWDNSSDKVIQLLDKFYNKHKE